MKAKIEELTLALESSNHQIEENEKEYNKTLESLQKEVDYLQESAYQDQIARNIENISQPNESDVLVRREVTATFVPEEEEHSNDHDKLICPICSIEYDNIPENQATLDHHVNEHLEGLMCPVCFKTFDKQRQKNYERHVNSHFDSSLVDFVRIENENGLF